MAHLQTAFSQLYRERVEQVYRYLFFRVGNLQDAQDLTAQTFLAAWEAFASLRGEFQGKSNEATWLFAIARHKAADYFRSRQAQTTRQSLSLDHLVELPDTQVDLEEEMVVRLQREEVIKTLRLLSPERAEALSLRFFAGLSHAEIAAVMGKQVAAVKMLVGRGLEDLKARLQHERA